MIERYSTPEMSSVWSEERRLAVWKEVETLVVEAWAELEVAPPEAAIAAREAPEVDVAEWKELESVTHHDVAAFVDLLADSVAVGGEWIHFGLTSSDVLDTANGVLLAEAGGLLLKAVEDLFITTRTRAFEFRNAIMVGRTHGIWAEPMSFGIKLASWAFEIERDHERLVDAVNAVSFGAISGAVGTYAHTPPEIETYVCGRLGIFAEPASTQVVPRDRHAHFLSVLALIGSSIERFATEIRHLQRSEVGEVREAFRAGQKGSSAMPHKRNPIGTENLTGISRLLRGYASTGLENVALWHERDISHSSVERVVLPDATNVLHYGLVRMRKIIENLVVDTQRMQTNLDATRGLVNSQAVLLALVGSGLTRDEAYRIVQRNAMATWDEGGTLLERLRADPDVILNAEALADCFTPERSLRHTDVIFDRLSSSVLQGKP